MTTSSADILISRRQPGKPRAQGDHRTPWEIDVDRILHSRSYTRYIDKTQVFYLIENDHITHRVLHVQMVSRIARTIGRRLGFNEDLLEAIALGHDLGHPPFGHDGESYLAELCVEASLPPFFHAVMSVRFLEHLERKGAGLNLTLATLDGILCHDGESDSTSLKPQGPASFNEFDNRLTFRLKDYKAHLAPMTQEGCLVRLCDTISYIGRDMEDAITVGLIKRDDLPAEVTGVLGDTNGQIVYHLVNDLINHSRQTGILGLSPPLAEALTRLKNFNRERIYFSPAIKTQTPKIKNMYRVLFETYLNQLEKNQPSTYLAHFIKGQGPDYQNKWRPAEITRDFIAGMTDDYFLRLGAELLVPSRQTSRFQLD